VRYVLRVNGGFNLEAALNCGQTFQWRRDAEGGWRGVIQGALVRIWQERDGLVCDSALPSEQVSAYFRLDDDLETIYASFPQDQAMQDAVAAFRGMRLVRQGLWECTLSFVCATNANIPRIQKMLAALCGRYGEPLEENVRAFPDPGALASETEDDLRALGLGYRAEHVLQTARRVDSGQFDLDELRSMNYDGAHARLQVLPGIGPKVADCICLFSLGWLQAVPVDVWVRRIILERVPSLRSYHQMAGFAREWLGPFAGYAQQYLFHYERTRAGRSCTKAPA
jgi:N-glycosylase/DNA lyase